MKFILTLCLLNCFIATTAQEEVSIASNDIELHGTLIHPEKSKKVVLIISGSGQTDRNGNTIGFNYTNNCLKLVAEELATYNIASLRYDKRGVGESKSDNLVPEKVRFDDFANDAVNWINYLKKDFDTVIVMGHSIGALIGILATEQTEIDQFISLAGIASSGYETLKRQLSTNQPPFVTEAAIPILDSLNSGYNVDNVPAYLNGLFHPKMQGYLMSWMKYVPQQEIKKLNIPILIVQGTTDVQITVEEAKKMATVNSNCQLKIIDNMNHVLKEVSTTEMNENVATYANPNLPLHPELMPTLVSFIKK